jgi:hypothetical protein
VTMNSYNPIYNLQANNAEPNGLEALQGQRKETEQTSKRNMKK